MVRVRVALAAVVALASAFMMVPPASAAPATGAAWFRMGHFASDVPPVDLYLVPTTSGSQRLVLKGLAYGGVSPYLRVTPGVYTANVRPAGADPASAPAITGTADIVAGSAYTFAAFGTAANLTKRLLTDDLTPPAPGRANVRLIQAADTPVTVDVLGAAVNPATITAYTGLAAGRPVVKVTAPGTPPVAEPVSLPTGSVHSLIVLRRGSTLEVSDVVDTQGPTGLNSTGNAAGGTVVANAPSTSAGRTDLPRTGAGLAMVAAVALIMIGLGRGMLVASRQ